MGEPWLSGDARSRISRGLPRLLEPILSPALLMLKERKALRPACLEKLLRFHRRESVTRWSALFTMLSALSREFWRANLFVLEADVLRPPSPSIWRTLLLLSPAESSSPLLTSPSLCWLSPRPWLSTLPRTPVTWLLS